MSAVEIAAAEPNPRLRRAWRQAVAAQLATDQCGVVHRRQLRALGITRFEVRSEAAARRWGATGRHTVVIGAGEPTGDGRLWWALWESGPGAVLDGASALVAGGLTGFEPAVIDVSVPDNVRSVALPGVRLTRRRTLARSPVRGGIPRTSVEVATIRAAQLAASDRQAALLICLPIQQRLTSPARLLATWEQVRYSARRQLIDNVVRDVCDGAHSLGELDFARLCRQRGIPEPVRQQVRGTPGERVYLDVEFPGGIVVEIDGVQHQQGLAQVDDALRANAVTIDDRKVLRIPVLGLRLRPDDFLDQVALALGRRPGISPCTE